MIKYYSCLLLLLPFFCNANSSNIQKILHITDIHYDSYYKEGTPSKCVRDNITGTGCCRETSIAIGNYSRASKWGDLNCDLPLLAVNSTLYWIKKTIPDIEFIIYTGDAVDHHDIFQTIDGNLQEITKMLSMFNYYFPKLPLYSVLGNHDTYPIDQTAPYIYQYILSKLFPIWSRWIKNNTNTLTKYGYYSIPINTNLQLVGFNSNYYDSINLYKIDSKEKERNDGYQMNWLESQFITAKKNKKKIMLLNHIPLFGGESISYYNTRMLSVLKKYNDTLLIHLNGHEHSDHFYLYHNNNTTFSYATIPNSLMASNNFPGFRVMEYNKTTNKLVNYKQYVCNLTLVIATDKYNCEELYDFQKLYRVPDMSTKSFTEVYNKLRTNITMLNKYLEYKDYGSPITSKCNYKDRKCVNQYLDEILV